MGEAFIGVRKPMTITKEIPVAQVRELDLHEGDSLRVISKNDVTLLVQIVHATRLPQVEEPETKDREYPGAEAQEEGGNGDRAADFQAREAYLDSDAFTRVSKLRSWRRLLWPIRRRPYKQKGVDN